MPDCAKEEGLCSWEVAFMASHEECERLKAELAEVIKDAAEGLHARMREHEGCAAALHVAEAERDALKAEVAALRAGLTLIAEGAGHTLISATFVEAYDRGYSEGANAAFEKDAAIALDALS